MHSILYYNLHCPKVDMEKMTGVDKEVTQLRAQATPQKMPLVQTTAAATAPPAPVHDLEATLPTDMSPQNNLKAAAFDATQQTPRTQAFLACVQRKSTDDLSLPSDSPAPTVKYAQVGGAPMATAAEPKAPEVSAPKEAATAALEAPAATPQKTPTCTIMDTPASYVEAVSPGTMATLETHMAGLAISSPGVAAAAVATMANGGAPSSSSVAAALEAPNLTSTAVPTPPSGSPEESPPDPRLLQFWSKFKKSPLKEVSAMPQPALIIPAPPETLSVLFDPTNWEQQVRTTLGTRFDWKDCFVVPANNCNTIYRPVNQSGELDGVPKTSEFPLVVCRGNLPTEPLKVSHMAHSPAAPAATPTPPTTPMVVTPPEPAATEHEDVVMTPSPTEPLTTAPPSEATPAATALAVPAAEPAVTPPEPVAATAVPAHAPAVTPPQPVAATAVPAQASAETPPEAVAATAVPAQAPAVTPPQPVAATTVPAQAPAMAPPQPVAATTVPAQAPAMAPPQPVAAATVPAQALAVATPEPVAAATVPAQAPAVTPPQPVAAAPVPAQAPAMAPPQPVAAATVPAQALAVTPPQPVASAAVPAPAPAETPQQPAANQTDRAEYMRFSRSVRSGRAPPEVTQKFLAAQQDRTGQQMKELFAMYRQCQGDWLGSVLVLKGSQVARTTSGGKHAWFTKADPQLKFKCFWIEDI